MDLTQTTLLAAFIGMIVGFAVAAAKVDRLDAALPEKIGILLIGGSLGAAVLGGNWYLLFHVL